jgi:hypothetical protein
MAILKMIPLGVWVGVAAVGALWYYGSYQKAQGVAQERARWVVASEREKARQAKEAAELVAAAEARADTLEGELAQLKGKINDAVKAANDHGDGTRVAIPRALLDRLRDFR